jgi:uncharacterized protein YjbJ (UPF0337 family)
MASIRKSVTGAAKQVAGKAKSAWGRLTRRKAERAAEPSAREKAATGAESERGRSDLAP